MRIIWTMVASLILLITFSSASVFSQRVSNSPATAQADARALYGEWTLQFEPPFYVSAFNHERKTLARWVIFIDNCQPGSFSGSVSRNAGAGPNDGQIRRRGNVSGVLLGNQCTIKIMEGRNSSSVLELSGTLYPAQNVVSGRIVSSSNKGVPNTGSFTLTRGNAFNVQSNRGPGATAKQAQELLGNWQVRKDRIKVESKFNVDQYYPATSTERWSISGNQSQGYTFTSDKGGTYPASVEGDGSYVIFSLHYPFGKKNVREAIRLRIKGIELTGTQIIALRDNNPSSSDRALVSYRITGQRN